MIPGLDLKGFGSEGFIISIILYIALVILLIVLKVIPVSKKDRANRKNQTVRLNPGLQPGDGETCKEHGTALTKLETEFDLKTKQICKSLDELKKTNRQDHGKIFDKLDGKVDKK